MKKSIKNVLIISLCLLPFYGGYNLNKETCYEPQIVFADSVNDSYKVQLSNDFSSLYETYSKSVVSVLNYQTNIINSSTTLKSFGSGFFINYLNSSNYYYIMTNYHVVQNASNLKLFLSDKTFVTLSASASNSGIYGYDEQQDVAILQVAKSLIPYSINTLEIASEAPKRGDVCIAIGTPASLTYQLSMSVGVVSGVNRVVVECGNNILKQDHAIQSDVAINPGNSGGPLLNIEGKVIGVNTLKLSSENYSISGLNFALPIDDMMNISQKFIGRISKKYSTRTVLSTNAYYRSMRNISLRERMSLGIDSQYKGVVLFENDKTLNLNKYSVISSIEDGSGIHYIDDVVQFRKYLLSKSKNNQVTLGVYKYQDNKLDDSISYQQVNLIEIEL